MQSNYYNIEKAKNDIDYIYNIADQFEFLKIGLSHIYKELYYKYPNSKFILTIQKMMKNGLILY